MRLSASVTLLNQAKLLVRGGGKVSGRDEGSAQEEIRLHSQASIGKATRLQHNQISSQNPEQALGSLFASKKNSEQ